MLDLAMPALTLNQAPKMFIHIEQGDFFNFGATKIQFMSGVFGPLPCTGSWVWSALCLRISFHGSPFRASPLTSSLAKKVSN